MKSLPYKQQLKRTHLVGAAFSIAVPASFFAILAIVTNTHWVPLYIPNFPWHEEPVLLAFETPLLVVVSMSAFAGATIMFVLWRMVYQQSIVRQRQLKQQIGNLEENLAKTQRLISSARNADDLPSGEI